MAGKGSRFELSGFTVPKPFIEVDGSPMFLFSSSTIDFDARYIYVIREEHLSYFNKYIKNKLTDISYEVVVQVGDSNGAVISSLLASNYIDNEDPLVIMDCDQRNLWNPRKSLDFILKNDYDGGIVVFESNKPLYSYVSTTSSGIVEKTAEKEVISDKASAGIYIWSSGCDFVKYSKMMVSSGITINNEFYICPVYNEAVSSGLKFITIPTNELITVGTPEDLNVYISSLDGNI